MAQMRRHIARAGVLTVALASAGVATGCGDGSESERNADGRPPRTDELASARRNPLISREDISRAGGDTPAAALLIWWQSVQFRDPEGARQMYAEGVPLRGIERDVHTLATFLAAAWPEVLETQVDGDRARLLVLVHGTTRNGDTVFPTESPATFRLVREEDGWKLEDNRYLAARVRAYEESIRSRRR